MRLKSTKHKRGLLVGVSCLILAVAVLGVYYSQHNTRAPANSTQTVAEKWLVPCTKQACINSGLQSITAKYGTQKALDSLDYYINLPHSLPGDNHLRAHYIGYQTEKSFGLNGKAFLSCSTSFDYGCMHGFIEQAEEGGVTPQDAAKMLCGPVEASSSYSSNMKYYCYHGIGHGVMDYKDYDLQAALKICDGLGSQLAQTGCWQGVFMENVSGYMSGAEKNGTFSKTDPLAPCDGVDVKYQRECYINQEGYLFSYYNWDIGKAARACLNAGTQTGTCMEGVGLAASSPAWQQILLGNQDSNNRESNAWLICSKFPAGYIATCVTGAVTQILEIDRFNFTSASKFCGLVNSSSQSACYRRIGEYTWLESPDHKKAAGYCDQLPAKWQPICRQGTQEYS